MMSRKILIPFFVILSTWASLANDEGNKDPIASGGDGEIGLHKAVVDCYFPPDQPDTAVFKIGGYLSSSAFSVTDLKTQVADHIIFIELKVEQTSEVGLTVLVPVTKEISVGSLVKNEGYLVVLKVNGVEAFSIKFIMGQVVEPPKPPESSVPFTKAAIQVVPAEPIDSDEVKLVITGVLPHTGFKQSPTQVRAIPTFRFDGTYLYAVDLTFEATGEVSLPVETPIKEEVAMGKLPSAYYAIFLNFNGVEVAATKFVVRKSNGENPDPVPNPAVPFTKAAIKVNPSDPTVNDEVLLNISGVLPHTGFKQSPTQLRPIPTFQFDGTYLYSVNLTFDETSEVHLPVETPINEEISMGKLPAANYVIFLNYNGTEVASTKFIVHKENGDIPITEAPFKSQVVFDPANPQEGETVSIYLTGEFPTPGYTFTRKQVAIMKSLPEQLGIDVEIQKPETPQAQVITPFKELLGTVTLTNGVHRVYATVNGINLYVAPLIIGEKPVDTNIPRIYNAAVVWEPVNPKVGETASIYITGEFPTPGYVIVDKKLAILESYPEQVSINVEIRIPVDPQAQVITPFKELIGTVILSQGIHPVHAAINGEGFFTGRLIVGDLPTRDAVLTGSNSLAYTFNQSNAADNQLQLIPPGANGEFPLGTVTFGEVPMMRGDEQFTDGLAIIVNLNAGEGATFLGKPIQVGDDYVFFRLGVRTWQSEDTVSLGLGGLDAAGDTLDKAALNGTIGLNLLTAPKRLQNHFGAVEAFSVAERGWVVPVFQVANKKDGKPVTIHIDNLEVYRIPRTSFPTLISPLTRNGG